MGLFNIFKRKPKLKDELFGELGYTSFKDRSRNFYDGTITFDSKQCGITIDADENGPTSQQKEFFKELSGKYPVLKTEVLLPFLNKELLKWNDKEKIVEFDKMFELDGISLPFISGKPTHWSLTVYSLYNKHWVTIHFVGWEPQEGVIIDG